MLTRSTSVSYYERSLQQATPEEEQGAWERNMKEEEGRESRRWGGREKEGEAMVEEEEGWLSSVGEARGGVWSVYQDLSSRRPLWSWVECEGGVKRRMEEEDGEEVE